MSRAATGLPVPNLTREAAVWNRGALLIGVDEVGRGPLAGPVVAAAAVFPPGCPAIAGVRDSKTLSGRQRAALCPPLRMTALGIGVGAASVREIDRLNIRRATALAMRRAITALLTSRGFREGAQRSGATGWLILIDGLPLPECGFEHDALIAGDAQCYSIAAAGIVAKELRDRLMRALAVRYPTYAWEHNAGYGTVAHTAALSQFGATPHHRRSFAPVAAVTEPR
ncbi:MAG: ribonuclease HII [Gemmatimonadales bacterium]